MRKADVIAGITAKTGKEKKATETIVDAFFKVVQASLINGEDVFVRGFGTFLVKKRAAKIGRNITKNIAVQIPESYIPAFRPGDEFKNKVKAAAIKSKFREASV
ncbi:HU family DNA-binding protein [Mucilaginibacter polytrichastri]|uniref:DNA-binding protein HU n=1 Tax=Mucilaginibacter polytrichastri TaxID=1302689 RepID=A0A1Q5ZW09_9SPHI|nr:HU family DNA-binding protein [Mucilaginibacter polytrichastri]OKS85888.1 DNA-binding protein HU [Mucilaginibacter polytrichastri]SFS60799.1 DNA-binding protein HU-beta [Mucilaginibacter polytrichastri]